MAIRECYRIKCGILENGLRFYTQRGDNSKELTIIAVLVGSLYDPKEKKGLAHLLEHVVCAETKELDKKEISALFERTMGGHDDNFYITTDYSCTTYGPDTIMGKKENRELFRVFSDMVTNPIITGKTMQTEKTAVLQEYYLRGEDAVEIYIEDLLKKHLFLKTPMEYSTFGHMPDVKTMTKQDLYEHVKKFYTPSNTIVVYMGPKYDDAHKVIEKNLGNWRANRKPPRIRTRDFVPLSKQLWKTYTRPGIKQWHACIGFSTETYCSEDAVALDILARIMSARLFNKLRTDNRHWRKGVYRTPVWTERTFMFGLFAAHFATLDEKFIYYAIETFHQECKNMEEQLVSYEEVEGWVRFIYNNEFINYFKENPGELAGEIIIAVANGDIDLTALHTRGEKLLSFITRNGRNKLRDVAKKYFSGNSVTIVVKPM